MKIWLAAAVAIAAGLIGVDAKADEWRVVSAAHRTLTVVDTQSLRRDNGRVAYWSLTLYETTQSDGVDYYMDRGVIDCNQMTFTLEEEVTYRTGGVVLSREAIGSSMSIVPSSIGATLHAALCLDQWPEFSRRFQSVGELISEARPALARMPVR